ncbi:uncharacterized protein LOC117780951 [Drosophila innubila]|uniref:uncharacterized protein LOC117780951 n=1 Tax=Drosophila innubila TaxID=198719 RepID=UPI00148E83B7|nr:uncharacterized protein LOC117780951 [Drosophila innubila]
MSKDELPRDAQVVHALRRELNRNTRRISQTFWQEFESIRNQQRDQLEQERRSRERITTLMRDTNLEAQQQLEALSRSISSHGINPAAPSPRMQREVPSIMPASEEQPMPERKSSPGPRAKSNTSNARATLKRRQPTSSVQFPASMPHLPRAPPSSRATIVPSNATPVRTSTRSTPYTSKLRLADKPKNVKN